jgi:polyisoprenyl-phosphate glycosyltransferase
VSDVLDLPQSGLTVVLPCYDEGEQVDRAYRAVLDALGVLDLEILFVDDGSKDDTLDRIRRLAADDSRVRYLSFSRNFGLSAAITAAFHYAGKPWTVQLDTDLQFPPAETWALLAKAAEGYDVVFGVRRQRRDPLLRRLGASWAQWLAQRVLAIEVPRGATSFRVLRTGVARTVADLPTANTYFSALVPLVGARYASVPTEHRPRTSGRSKFRLSRLAGHAFELFFGFSWRPLNAVYLLAAVAAGTGVALAVAAESGAVSQLAVSVATLVLAAATLVAVGLVGRYLHRRLHDTRPTRPYYIREANLPVHPEDTFDGGEPRVPPPVRPAAPRAAAVASLAEPLPAPAPVAPAAQ